VLLVVGGSDADSTLRSLLPEPSGWTLAEDPAIYLPGTLFEYIDGGAENYLSYGFRELIVATYKGQSSPATLTVEIYDMENDTHAFGIYSSERYPESRFLPVGIQGYWEEGALNFVVGSYYVKLLCFDCGPGGESSLTSIAKEIEKKVVPKGQLPPLVGIFPGDGLISNSEKFVLHNVLGYAFLHHGYLANYTVEGQEFELFIIEGADAREAQSMMEQYLASQSGSGQAPQPGPVGFHVRDRYAQNVFLAPSGNLILGVMRVKDGYEAMGAKYLELLAKAAKNRAATTN
jgi:hypothetical protein